jgi:hypothetical protein
MVTRAKLLLRASGTSRILPSSSGVPGLAIVAYVLPIDRRFEKLGDREGIARLSLMPRFGTWGADRDLGMADIPVGEGVNIGESNTGAWVTLLFSAIPGKFVRGGGTWVFLGSTSI